VYVPALNLSHRQLIFGGVSNIYAGDQAPCVNSRDRNFIGRQEAFEALDL
jgi:hypothetical protein